MSIHTPMMHTLVNPHSDPVSKGNMYTELILLPGKV